MINEKHATTSLGHKKESKPIDITEYRKMIGSLLYLTTSRPSIMFSVCLCFLFQADPKDVHLRDVKRISNYLKRTSNLGLYYRA